MTLALTKPAEFVAGEMVVLWEEIPSEYQGTRSRFSAEDAVVVSVDGNTVLVQRSDQRNTFAPDADGKYRRVAPKGKSWPEGITLKPVELRKRPAWMDAKSVPAETVALSPMQRFFAWLGKR